MYVAISKHSMCILVYNYWRWLIDTCMCKSPAMLEASCQSLLKQHACYFMHNNLCLFSVILCRIYRAAFLFYTVTLDSRTFIIEICIFPLCIVDTLNRYTIYITISGSVIYATSMQSVMVFCALILWCKHYIFCLQTDYY